MPTGGRHSKRTKGHPFRKGQVLANSVIHEHIMMIIQWFSTFLIMCPFNTASPVVVTPTTNYFLLPLLLLFLLFLHVKSGNMFRNAHT